METTKAESWKLRILRAARSYLSNRENWTTGRYYRLRGAVGFPKADMSNIESCCVYGAVRCFGRKFGFDYLGAERILEHTSYQLYKMMPSEVNDRLGYEATLKLLDATIAAEEKLEAAAVAELKGSPQ